MKKGVLSPPWGGDKESNRSDRKLPVRDWMGTCRRAVRVGEKKEESLSAESFLQNGRDMVIKICDDRKRVK